MKAVAYILITAGFLLAAYYSVIDTDQVPWNVVVPSLLMGLAGVAMIQISNRVQRRETDTVRSNIDKLEQSLSSIVDHATQLDADKGSIDVYDFHGHIDELFMADLDVFVENRESIAHAYGLQEYADIMTHFATGERYLNRCWSASTDGYVDEVNAYLTRARDQFAQSLEMLRYQG